MDESAQVGDDASKRAKTEAEELIHQRLLVESRASGSIIGKGGENINKIRAASDTYISFGEKGSASDRVCTIKGKTVEGLAKAISGIIEVLAEAAQQRAERNATPGTDIPVGSPAPIRLLVHKTQVGCIIGKGGDVIKETQKTTGANVHLETEPFPGTTEKMCTVTGSQTQVHDACLAIFSQLAEAPLRPGGVTTLYVPGAAAPPPFGAPPGFPAGLPPPPGGFNPYAAAAPPRGRAPVPGGEKVEKIVIPTVCAGSVIGKAGSVVRMIREQSGVAGFSIADPEPTAPDDRVITITGNPTSIQAAIDIVRKCVENYEPRAGGATPVGFGAAAPTGYGAPPPAGFGAPSGFGAPPAGFGGYPAPNAGYGAPPGYGAPAPQAYAAPPAGAYGAAPTGYNPYGAR